MLIEQLGDGNNTTQIQVGGPDNYAHAFSSGNDNISSQTQSQIIIILLLLVNMVMVTTATQVQSGYWNQAISINMVMAVV